MADEMRARVTDMIDSARFENGKPRDVTIVRFFIGTLGPFEEVLERSPDKYAIQAAIQKRKDALDGNV